MRITNLYMANNIMSGIQDNLSNLAKSQEQIATSKSILRPSDNPGAIGQLMAIKSTLSYNEQYNRNIDDGLSYLNMSDTTMGTMGDILSSANELTLQAANDTYTADDRKAIAQQINKMIDQVADLGNSTVGGKYIYAGTKNSKQPFTRVGDKITYNGDTSGIYRQVMSGTSYRVDSPGVTTGVQITATNDLGKASSALPVVVARQSDKDKVGIINLSVDVPTNEVTIDGLALDGTTPDPNLITGYNYDPSTKAFEVTSGDLTGLKIDFNASNSGSQYTITVNNQLGVFGNTDGKVVYDPASAAGKATADKGIFDTLFALRDRLNANDTAGLQTSIDEIKRTSNQILQNRTQVGARTKQFESLQAQLADQEVKLTDSLDKIEGADMSKLSIAVAQQQLSYQASLSIGAKIMQTSLLNYLR